MTNRILKNTTVLLTACICLLLMLVQIGCKPSTYKVNTSPTSVKSGSPQSSTDNKTFIPIETPTGTTGPINIVTNTPTLILTPSPTPTPTPTPTKTPEVQSVIFSKSAGFYDSAFSLTLSAPSGYTIYYTIDGSDPRTSGIQYNESISILKSAGRSVGPITKSFNAGISTQFRGNVVKAYAKNENFSTPVITQSYFVSQDLATQYKLPYISITMKASDFEAPTGIYSTVMLNPFIIKERKVVFCEFFESDGKKMDELFAEISMQGNGSLGAPQKSMRLYFKNDIGTDDANYPSKLKYDIFQGRVKDIKGETITSFKRLLLRNSGNDFNASFLRDRLLQKVSEPLKVDYQESRAAMIFINGEFWGMYNVRERYDTKYFRDHYGIAEENFTMLEAPTPLKYGMDYTRPFELCDGVAGDEKPWQALITYANNNNLAIEANYKKVADQLDLNSLIDMFVANIYMCNMDWPGNNIKVWRNKNANDPSGMDTKWHFVLMDMDMGAGWETNIASKDMMGQAFDSNVIMSRLMKALLNNDSFKTMFINRFEQVVNEVYKPELMIPVLEQMANEIKSAMVLNIARWPKVGNSVSNWNSQITKTRTFLQTRGSYAKQQLHSYFGK